MLINLYIRFLGWSWSIIIRWTLIFGIIQFPYEHDIFETKSGNISTKDHIGFISVVTKWRPSRCSSFGTHVHTKSNPWHRFVHEPPDDEEKATATVRNLFCTCKIIAKCDASRFLEMRCHASFIRSLTGKARRTVMVLRRKWNDVVGRSV